MMASSRKQLERMLDQLWKDYNQTSEYLVLASKRAEIQTNLGLKEEEKFFTVCTRACTEAGILGLARLIIPDKESLSIWYLLDFIRNHPQLFPHLPRSELKAFREEQQQIIRDHEQELNKVRHYRDRCLAHRDRKWINAPHNLLPNKLNLPELLSILETIGEILDSVSHTAGYEKLDLREHSKYLNDLDSDWNYTD